MIFVLEIIMLILIGILIIFTILYSNELRLKVKHKKNPLCSYCACPVTDRFTMSWALTPTMYGCDRWWCKILKKIKVPVVKITYKKLIEPKSYSNDK